jgi:Aldehyde dehydrogenase family
MPAKNAIDSARLSLGFGAQAHDWPIVTTRSVCCCVPGSSKGPPCVNGGMFYGADAPFGGYKNSGVGRQCGIEGFQQYLETKTIGHRIPRQG